MGYRNYFQIIPKAVIDSIQEADSLEKALELGGLEYASPSCFKCKYVGIGKIRDVAVHTLMQSASTSVKWVADEEHECMFGGVELLQLYAQYELKECIDRLKEVQTLEEFEIEKRHRLQWLEYSGFLDFSPIEEKGEVELAGSWLREHELFNILYLIKTVNFDENYVVFSGW